MAITWSSIRSLALFLGPLLLPRAISYYRSVRQAARTHGYTVRPVPANVSRALTLLFVVAVAFLVRSLPREPFAPEEIFSLTNSRLAIPVDTLFHRVAKQLRPGESLTPRDEALRAKFVNMESRLLYFQYGPEAMGDCPFCSIDRPDSYMYYSVVGIAMLHLVNFLVLTLVTSPLLAGRDGAHWRQFAALGAGALLVADLAMVRSFNPVVNKGKHMVSTDVELFFWNQRAYRNMGLAALDAVLGWLMWLSSTNRAFVRIPTTMEQLDKATTALHAAKSQLSALGIVRNTASRDEQLRARVQAYWEHEVQLMDEVMEERDVIESINDALENRVSVQKITKDANAYTQAVMQQWTAASAAAKAAKTASTD